MDWQWSSVKRVYLRLTGTEGNEVWVSVSELVAIQGVVNGKGSRVKLATGGQPLTIAVQEEPGAVMKLLRENQK